MYADLLRYDLCAFIHRSFLELEQSKFHWNWHLEVLAAKLEDVRLGRCQRLIVNVLPQHPCVYRKLDPNVLMMESAQNGVRTHDAGSLNRTRDRRILVQ